jgi:hypothetical protein
MRRSIVVLLVVALAFGALAPAQAKKKKKKKPVPVEVTYNVGYQGEACVLSVTTDLATEDGSCGDPFAGSTTGPVAGSGEPVRVTAVDGLPLTLDASKPITGTLHMGSYTLAALADAGAGQPLGFGEAQWHIVLTGTSGGTDITIGEVDTEAYTVMPGTGDYEVTFEITPPTETAKKVFDALTLSLEQTGSATLHGALQPDGTSSLVLGAFAKK